MINSDFDKIKKRYEQYWNKENDTALLSVITDKDNANWDKFPKPPENITDRWLDIEYNIKKFRFLIENLAYIGESFPHCFANFGPDILGAILGCGIEFGENTSWAIHIAQDITEIPELKYNPNNIWYRRMMEMTEAMLKDSKGDYLVGNNDFHTGLGAITSLIGPEQMCIGLLSEPEIIKQRLSECAAIYQKVYNNISNLIKKYQFGVTNWMGLYSDKDWYVPSCDVSCLISIDNFDEFVLPNLKNEVNMYDRSIYHLDGKEAIRHLDSILTIDKLNGVQWVYGAGQPSARYWLPLLKKIQNAGKLIEIEVQKEDIKELLNNLEPQGLSMRTRAKNETEAYEMYDFVKKFKK